MMNAEPDPAVGAVRTLMSPWIDDPHRGSGQLLQWLTGNALSPVGQDDEPYVWILRALPRGSQLPAWETALSIATADLLSQASEILNSPHGEAPVYNLLGLCSTLRGRDWLPGPLIHLYRENTLRDRRHDSVTLNSMLLSALIFNQRDNILEPVWKSLVQGLPDSVLGGNPSDGLQGLIHMPPSEIERGTPAVDALGFGLTHFIRFLENRPQKVRLLRSWFQKLQDRYPDFDWNFQLVHFSEHFQWPVWTDIALPKLSIRPDKNRPIYVVWGPVASVTQEFGGKVLSRVNGGRVCRIEVPDHRIKIFERVSRTAEGYRRSGSFGVKGADKGTLSTLCEELKSQFRTNRMPEEAETIRLFQVREAEQALTKGTTA